MHILKRSVRILKRLVTRKTAGIAGKAAQNIVRKENWHASSAKSLKESNTFFVVSSCNRCNVFWAFPSASILPPICCTHLLVVCLFGMACMALRRKLRRLLSSQQSWTRRQHLPQHLLQGLHTWWRKRIGTSDFTSRLTWKWAHQNPLVVKHLTHADAYAHIRTHTRAHAHAHTHPADGSVGGTHRLSNGDEIKNLPCEILLSKLIRLGRDLIGK